MSLRIIKQGILDTIQDGGRWGYQHLGINPNGAMDQHSAQLANALLGKELSEAVIELHFPAAQILFEHATVICITGADFSPTINDISVPLNHPIVVTKDSLLKFTKPLNGSRAYLSILHSLQIENWLGSYSTNLTVTIGGFKGRALKKDDVILFKNNFSVHHLLHQNPFTVLPWKAYDTINEKKEVHFIKASEWHWLTDDAQYDFQHCFFQITNEADRMGYRLKGPALTVNQHESLVSSAVSFGTVQLLPNGQLIVLMADHQTTGGYPKIAHIISADLPALAQKHTNNNIKFSLIDLETAENLFLAQQKMLQQLQIACKFRLEELTSK